jgi:transcriptional repressor NrdR
MDAATVDVAGLVRCPSHALPLLRTPTATVSSTPARAATGAVIRRRRECLECNRRFTSYEQIEEVQYMVVKHDGRREEFSRNKLLEGLRTAARKRPISTRQLEEIVDATENLLHQREDREISTQDIGAFVMDRLKTLDQVAYVRFASVYRRFDDIEAFQQVLKNLIHNPAGRGVEGVSRCRQAEPALLGVVVVSQLRSELDRLIQEVLAATETTNRGRLGRRPPTSSTSVTALLVQVEVAGADPADLRVEVDGSTLRVHGRRRLTFPSRAASASTASSARKGPSSATWRSSSR